jgi:hypothetical protein
MFNTSKLMFLSSPSETLNFFENNNVKEFDVLFDKFKEFETSCKQKKLEELMLLSYRSYNLVFFPLFLRLEERMGINRIYKKHLHQYPHPFANAEVEIMENISHFEI